MNGDVTNPNDGPMDPAQEIANAGTPDYAAPTPDVPVDDQKPPETDPAPAGDGNPDNPPAPASGQPGKGNDGSDAGEPDPLEAEMAKELGIKPEEPDTVDTLRKKYEDSSKEAHRLVEEIQRIDQYFEQAGLKRMVTDEGIKLVPTEKFTAEMDESVIPAYKTLDDALQVQIDEPEYKAIAKHVAAGIMATRPAPNASPDDITIPQNEINEAFNQLIESKAEDGTTLKFPDAGDPKVLNWMKAVYDKNPHLKNAMLKDKEAYQRGLEMLYELVDYRRMKIQERMRQGSQPRKPDISPNGGGSFAGDPKPKGGSNAAMTAEEIAGANPR